MPGPRESGKPVREIKEAVQAMDGLSLDDVVEVIVQRILKSDDPWIAIDFVVSALQTDDRLC
jgi:hypothetical protein